MKKAIIVPNRTKDRDLAVTSEVIAELTRLGIYSYINSEHSSFNIDGACFYDNPPTDADIMIVVGGDGSIIDASALALSLGLPILGVNLGRVGYLSEIEPANLSRLSALIHGGYTVEERMLIKCAKFSSDGTLVSESNPAVNDIVVSHKEYFGIGEMRVSDSHGDSVKYRADGVIASTPTGSTAYSLSAGGPIVAHHLEAITVTPVCPHSFFNRAIVFGADERITVTNVAAALNISVDGRYFDTLESGEFIRVSCCDERLRIITFTENNMFSTLSVKIKTLEDTL